MNRFLFEQVNGNGGVSSILNRSSKAVCGAFEREVIVKNSEVNKVKSKLRSAGYVIIGTGKGGFNTTKIWFNPAGVNL